MRFKSLTIVHALALTFVLLATSPAYACHLKDGDQDNAKQSKYHSAHSHGGSHHHQHGNSSSSQAKSN